MPLADPFTPPGPDAVAVGTGRLTLDVIVRTGGGNPSPPRSQAGGTCGNVLANLAYLGWSCYPLTDLGDDDPGARFVGDLERWGVRVDLIRRLEGEQTPVIIHHIRETPPPSAERPSAERTAATHSFSSRCPFCGRRLRYYEPLAAKAVLDRLPAVPPTRVCFFDRDSEGALLLARHCSGRGALVVFEPNYAGRETLFPEALASAHVLKYARDKLPHLGKQYSLDGPLLLIETLGAEGLRYLDRRGPKAEWEYLPAFAVDVVRDAGGSGDWCTAGFVHLLGQRGLQGFRAASGQDVREALRFGQALASWGCRFEGARGGVYRGDRAGFAAAVRAILAGESPVAPADEEPTFALAGKFCPRCGGVPR
jgi:fructokinase